MAEHASSANFDIRLRSYSESSSSSAPSQDISIASQTSASMDNDQKIPKTPNPAAISLLSPPPTSLSTPVLPASPVSPFLQSSASRRPKLQGKRGSTMNGPLYMQSGPNSHNPYLVRTRHNRTDEGMAAGFLK